MGRGAQKEFVDVERVAPDIGLAEQERQAAIYARKELLEKIAAAYGAGSRPDESLLSDEQVADALREGSPLQPVQHALMCLLVGSTDELTGLVAAKLRQAKVIAGLDIPFSPYVLAHQTQASSELHLVSKPGSLTTLCGLHLSASWLANQPRGRFASDDWACGACHDRAWRRPYNDPLRQAATESSEDAGLSDEEAVAFLDQALNRVLTESTPALASFTVAEWFSQIEQNREERLLQAAGAVEAILLLARPESERINLVFRRWKPSEIAEEASLGELASLVKRHCPDSRSWPSVAGLAAMITNAGRQETAIRQRSAFAGALTRQLWPEAAQAFLSRYSLQQRSEAMIAALEG